MNQSFKSAIFEGTVRHRRLTPKPHEFSYKVFMMYLDLAELDRVLACSSFWSAGKFNLAWFRRRDYLSPEIPSLDEAVRRHVQESTGEAITGPIRLLTNLRYFGYLINPISCYYCFDNNEQLRYIVAEVTNTPWRDRVSYTIPCAPDQHHQSHSFVKRMHVSPFMPMKMTYRWQSKTPGASIRIHLQNWLGDKEAFNATVGLRRIEITQASLDGILIRYPFMTAKVGLSIYWQALKLFCKRIPIFRHSPTTTGEKQSP